MPAISRTCPSGAPRWAPRSSASAFQRGRLFRHLGSETIEVSSSALRLYSYVASSDVTPRDTGTVSPPTSAAQTSSLSVYYIKITPSQRPRRLLCLTTALPRKRPRVSGFSGTGAHGRRQLSPRYSSFSGSSPKYAAGSSNPSPGRPRTIRALGLWATAVSYTVDFASGGTVSYDADMNIPLTFDDSDFKWSCRRVGLLPLLVTFTMPAFTSGQLFYDTMCHEKGTSVTATPIFRESSPIFLRHLRAGGRLRGHRFHLHKGYRPTAAIWPHAGNRRVKQPGRIVSYTVDKIDSLQFDAAAFCRRFRTPPARPFLLKFTLPSLPRNLYYDYTSSSITTPPFLLHNTTFSLRATCPMCPSYRTATNGHGHHTLYRQPPTAIPTAAVIV
jgi:hypothetical protein